MWYYDSIVYKSGSCCWSIGVTNNLAVDPAVEVVDLAATELAIALVRSFFHHAFKHSQASIMSSIGQFLSVVRSFFMLLNTPSHSVDIAGQDKVSRV